MKMNMLSIDIICGPDSIPYKAVGIFNVLLDGKPKPQMLELDIDVTEDITLKEILNRLFDNFGEFEKSHADIQEAKANMKSL